MLHNFLFVLMRFFLLAAGAALLARPTHAQVGVRAGGNLAYVREIFSRNAFPSTTIARVGYQAGVYYELALGKHWQLVPEVAFSRESQQLRKEGFGYATYYLNDGSYLIHDYEATFSGGGPKYGDNKKGKLSRSLEKHCQVLTRVVYPALVLVA